MDDMNIPVLVKHTEIPVEKQMGKLDYVLLNVLITWAALEIYKQVWACDLIFDRTCVSVEYVLSCFKNWMGIMTVLGILLTWKERTGENAIANVVFPFEIAVLVHVLQYYRTIVVAVYIALLGIVVAALTVLIVLGLIRTRKKPDRVRKVLIRVRDILVVALLLAVPMSQVLMHTMPEPYMPPVLNMEPNLVSGEAVNAAERLVQGV